MSTPLPICRVCGETLTLSFADLGVSPLANSYIEPERAAEPEPVFPLHVRVCPRCWLVQLPEVAAPDEIFGDYAYFSSYSTSWVEHARRYVEMVVDRFRLGPVSRVMEIASNDGYLLQWFAEREIPVLGVEPAANVAAAAEAKGIPSLVRFFGTELAAELAAEGRRAELIVGNNVLAHTPSLNDFVAGLSIALAPGGVVTMEFPHLQRLVEENQFDTIYHEHFSYFSFHVVHRVFARHALELFDVDELPTHGGSLRIYARHVGSRSRISPAVEELLQREEALGYLSPAPYEAFGDRVRATKRSLLSYLGEAKEAGRRVVGYGAPAKGNTLLNYCGVGPDLLEYTVDRSPHKQGRLLPGTRIPIHAPERILEDRPDDVLILPWNLKKEIAEQMSAVRSWGGRFLVAIPEVTVLP